MSPSQPSESPDADEPQNVGKADQAGSPPGAELQLDDLAWSLPTVVMWPLAAIFAGLLCWAFELDWVLVSLVPFAILLGVITVIDLRELRIPDKLTRPASLLTMPLLALGLLSDWSDLSLVRAVLGALAMGGFYFVLLLINPAGMGWGDVKLAPIIGAQLGFFGWLPLVRGLIAAYFILGPIAITLMVFGRARLKTGLPFGPFMALGAIVALVLEGHGY